MCSGGCLRGPLARTTAEASLTAGADWVFAPGVAVPEPPGPAGCGAQALAAVLATAGSAPADSAGRASAADALAAALPWHDHGATPIDLLLEARRRGFDARVAAGSIDDLSAAVARGEPPLVMLDAGLEVRTLTATLPLPAVMHWAVVTGVRRDGDRISVGAPNGRHHVVDAAWFDVRWRASDRCVIHVRRPETDGTPPAP